MRRHRRRRVAVADLTVDAEIALDRYCRKRCLFRKIVARRSASRFTTRSVVPHCGFAAFSH